jgi:hypothetical protein
MPGIKKLNSSLVEEFQSDDMEGCLLMQERILLKNINYLKKNKFF